MKIVSMTEEHGTTIIPSKIHNDRKITIDSKRVITELHILTANTLGVHLYDMSRRGRSVETECS